MSTIIKETPDVFSCEGLIDSVRRRGLKISEYEMGGFKVNDIVVPYNYVPWLFRTWGVYDVDNRLYRLRVGSASYTYSSENGTREFRKNGLLHCTFGPARVSAAGEEYYLNGFKVSSLGDKDKKIDIRSDPDTFISLLYHKEVRVTQYSNRDDLILDLPGYTFELKRRKEGVDTTLSLPHQKKKVDEAILSGAFRIVPGYDVVSVKISDRNVAALFDELRSCSKIDTYHSSLGVDIDAKKSNGDFLSVTLDGASGSISVSRYTPSFVLSDKEAFSLYPSDRAGDSSAGLTPWSDFVDEQDKGELERLLDELTEVYSSYEEGARDGTYFGGYYISGAMLERALYSDSEEAYFWVDEDGQYSSPAKDHPAYISKSGYTEYYLNGHLHRENGPAVSWSGVKSSEEYWIHGRRCTYDEMIHYMPLARRIDFRKDGVLHRVDGPALIKFDVEENSFTEEFWINGKLYDSEQDAQKGAMMSEETSEKNTRLAQIYKGGKLGLKKGAVNGAADLAASKIVSGLSVDDKEWTKEFTKIVLTGGTAELVDLLPDDSLERARISAEKKDELTYFLRNLTGENIGRNIVMLMPKIMSSFKDLLSFSAEEIEEAAETIEENSIPWEDLGISEKEDDTEEAVEETLQQEYAYVK